MFQLLRRWSSSFLPRNDRPWEEDATSNAPRVGSKRRRDAEPDEEHMVTEDGTVRSKRSRPDAIEAEQGSSSRPLLAVDPIQVPLPTDEADAARESSPVAEPLSPTIEKSVKEVTQGVNQVELVDKDDEAQEPAQPTSSVLEVQEQGAQPEASLAVAEDTTATEKKDDADIGKVVVDNVISSAELIAGASIVAPTTQDTSTTAVPAAEAAPTEPVEAAAENGLTDAEATDLGAMSLPTPPEEVDGSMPYTRAVSDIERPVPSSASPEPMSKQDRS